MLNKRRLEAQLINETINMSVTDAELLEIREKLVKDETSEALILAKKAADKSPKEDGRAFELLGEVYAELADVKKARSAFKEAVSRSKNITNDQGYEKYLWLAQINDNGSKALKLYQKGVTILERLLIDKGEDADLKKKIQGAYCSIAELFMTDLCMQPDAEENCELYTKLALQIDATNAEALQTLASMRISQQKIEEAKDALSKCLQSISRAATEDSVDLPTYAVRTSIVRLLIEVEMHEEAHQLLVYLQKEDDQILDIWYLLGWNCYVEAQNLQEQGNGSEEEIKELLMNAKFYFISALGVYQKIGWDDEGIKSHIQELLEILNGLGVPNMDEENEEAEWETSENEEEMDKD